MAAAGLSGGDGDFHYYYQRGEPLMHPELEEVIRHIRTHGMIAGMITNGFLLSKERIASLNAAGLEHLQISIDNVTPDEVSKKKFEDAGFTAGMAFAVRNISGEHQLGSGQRREESGRCADHCSPGGGFDLRARWESFTTITGS